MKLKNNNHTSFCEFIDERYIIVTEWMEDEEDNYFDYVYIIDTKEEKIMKYDGTCEVYDNIVILYSYII